MNITPMNKNSFGRYGDLFDSSDCFNPPSAREIQAQVERAKEVARKAQENVKQLSASLRDLDIGWEA